MTALDRQLLEDRALRDAALRLFKSDLAIVKADIRERGVAARIADRIGDSTLDMVDDAVGYAEGHKGTLAAVLAAIVAWFARGPIIDALTDLVTDEVPEEPEGVADRLRALNPFKRE